MKIVLSAGTLYTLPLEKIFEIGRDTGFDGIEIIINYDFQYGSNVNLIRDLESILPISALHAPFLELDGWGNKIDQLYRTATLAADTGIPLVNFHPPAWLALELKFWRWFNRIKDFQKEVGQGKVIITAENMPCIGSFSINPHVLGHTRRMIDFMKEKNLFLTFDTAHMGSSKASFLGDFHLFYNSGTMRNIHFSDYGNGREHLLPGHGALPLTRFLNHLRNTGYDEVLTLELSPYEFAEEEELIRESLADVLTYLRGETKKAATDDRKKNVAKGKAGESLTE